MSPRFLSRRQMLQATGGGIASLAFQQLLRAGEVDPTAPLAKRPSHFPGKAKAVISIFCYGGVSHVDTFDPKPLLRERQGEALTGKGPVVVSQGHPGGLMPSLWNFRKYGESGMEVSDLFPHVAKKVDEIATRNHV